MLKWTSNGLLLTDFVLDVVLSRPLLWLSFLFFAILRKRTSNCWVSGTMCQNESCLQPSENGYLDSWTHVEQDAILNLIRTLTVFSRFWRLRNWRHDTRAQSTVGSCLFYFILFLFFLFFSPSFSRLLSPKIGTSLYQNFQRFCHDRLDLLSANVTFYFVLDLSGKKLPDKKYASSIFFFSNLFIKHISWHFLQEPVAHLGRSSYLATWQKNYHKGKT